MDSIPEYHFNNQEEWHHWLCLNHEINSGIYIIFFKKKSGINSLNYIEAVEEALCFGWIDSKVKSIDNQRYKQYFCKRKSHSVWSLINKRKVEALMEEGRIQPAGLLTIEEAKNNGKWDIAYTSKKPDQFIDKLFLQAINNNPVAAENYSKMSKSHQLQYQFWINSAKKETTKIQRIEKALDLISKNVKPGIL